MEQGIQNLDLPGGQEELPRDHAGRDGPRGAADLKMGSEGDGAPEVDASMFTPEAIEERIRLAQSLIDDASANAYGKLISKYGTRFSKS